MRRWNAAALERARKQRRNAELKLQRSARELGEREREREAESLRRLREAVSE